MSNGQVRYNPGIQGESKLITDFVIRSHYLDLVLETLKEKTDGPSRHLIIVGSRGIGKTTLVRRVAAEVRANEELGRRWYPIVFAEESYEVGTPGEFWLAALFHLSDQTQDERMRQSYDELKGERDETQLRERALAQLMDFADTQRKKILLIVENLNMILGQQISDDDAWVLRHTLQNEPRLMLLGTAPARFKEIEHVNKAWFEMMVIYDLKPLTDLESGILWESLTSDKLSKSRLRPIKILTGGNPRLLSILASFAVQTSFRQLMDNLIQLLDDHTEYFKGQLDGLPALERKVFVALLDLWDPSTASDIAAAARIGVSKASSVLNRLVNRGAVSVARTGRKKMYQATERLYNIYYLMRRRGNPSETSRVHAVVTFMIQFYEGDQIFTTVTKLAEEACQLDPEKRREHYYAYEDILGRLPESDRLKMVDATPPEFFGAPDAPDIIRDLATIQERVILQHPHSTTSEAVSLMRAGNDLLRKKSFKEARGAFEKAIELDRHSYLALHSLGYLQEQEGNLEEAKGLYSKAIEIQSDYAPALWRLGNLCNVPGSYSEAESFFKKVCDIEPDNVWAFLRRAEILSRHLGNSKQAEICLRKVLELNRDFYEAWYLLAECLHDQERYVESRQALDQAVTVKPDAADAWAQLGHALGMHLELAQEAEAAYRKAIELVPTSSEYWGRLGQVFKNNTTRYQEAEQVFRKALELAPDDSWALAELGHLLFHHLGRPAEGEEALRKSVEGNPYDTWAWGMLANLKEKQKDYEEAELSLRRALGYAPADEDLWHHLGHLLLRIDRHADAEKVFQKLVDMNPNLGGAWQHLGDINRTLQQYAQAEMFYQRALERSPSNGRVLTELATVYEILGRTEEAALAYRRAIEVDPDRHKSWISLIEFLLNGHKYSDAMANAQRFVALFDREYLTVNKLASLFYQKAPREYLPEAEAWATSALENAPTDKVWLASHSLAVILGGQGKWDEALEVAPAFLNEAGSQKRAVKRATDFIVSAAAEGYAEEALRLVRDSKGAEALEPLIFGLELFLGSDEYKAQEIFEIARDVAERIRKEQDNEKLT